MRKWIVKRLSKNEGTGYSARTVIIIGFVLSLSMGFLDVTKGILSDPSGLSSFPFILPPLAATVGFFFLLYLTLWFLVVSQIGSFLKLEAHPLALSFAFFLGIGFILSLINVLPNISHPEDLIQLFVPILILMSTSFLISIGAYFATKVFIQVSSYRNTVIVISLVVPFVLAETMVFLWLHVYRIGPLFSVQSLLLSIGYILTALCTLVLFYRIGQIRTIIRLLTAFTVVIVLSPFVTLITVQASENPLREYTKNIDHKIKHVILITVDTLRPDFLSCYNRQTVSTPHIDQLAGDGILFSKAISPAPWTLPSVASIMTGLSPSVHTATGRESKLPDNLKTLAEYMLHAGYFTAGIGFNYFLLPRSNISQGFLKYNFFPRLTGNTLGSLLLKLFSKRFFNPFLSDASTRDLTRLAIDWLESSYEKDFFLWIHYFDPHAPYGPPADFLPAGDPPPAIGMRFSKQYEVRGGYFVPSLVEREWIKKLYDGEVRYVDENIGKLLDTLKRLKLYDESLIILTSDHGEEFWEHGAYEHGHALYNEVLWIPLIIKFPVSASKGQINTVVSTQSIMPTILDLCGIDYKGDYLSSGSLTPLWGPNPNDFNEQPVISTGLSFYEDRESVIFDSMKYIRFLVTNHEEFYDLAHDPEERISTVSLSPEKIERARDILRDHKKTAKGLAEHYRIVNVEEVKFDKETTQGLKSLGYVQ